MTNQTIPSFDQSEADTTWNRDNSRPRRLSWRRYLSDVVGLVLRKVSTTYRRLYRMPRRARSSRGLIPWVSNRNHYHYQESLSACSQLFSCQQALGLSTEDNILRLFIFHAVEDKISHTVLTEKCKKFSYTPEGSPGDPPDRALDHDPDLDGGGDGDGLGEPDLEPGEDGAGAGQTAGHQTCTQGGSKCC